jgi:HAD superfamily hydrolase (TIGR01490 family)
VKKRIAFFDFDGTITTKDTLLEIIRYCCGKPRFYAGFALNLPFLLAYKAGIISNQKAKERILTHFFGRTSLAAFQETCDRFALNKIPSLLRPKALTEIKKLQEAGARVVIVSASAGNWIQAWCQQMGIEIIATRLAQENQLLTGKIEGKNCYGDEKVNRIKLAIDLTQYDEVYCYGDTKGDKPMLGLATFAFYKPFR